MVRRQGQRETKRGARRPEETRRRITEATVELHEDLGPAATTISAIAERAGVQRLTVYRHFPDDRALLSACSSHYMASHPLPDPAPWAAIPDPEERLRVALAEVYAYHRGTERMMNKVLRDADTDPVTREFVEPYLRYWDRSRYVLATGWGAEGERLELLLAALGHALDLRTWSSLALGRGLEDRRIIDLMVVMVRCGVGG